MQGIWSVGSGGMGQVSNADHSEFFPAVEATLLLSETAPEECDCGLVG